MASRPSDLSVPRARIARALRTSVASSMPVDSPVPDLATTPKYTAQSPSSVVGAQSPSAETWKAPRSRQSSISSEGSNWKQSPSTEKAPTVVGMQSPSIETWKPLKSRQSATSFDVDGRNRSQIPGVEALGNARDVEPVVLRRQEPVSTRPKSAGVSWSPKLADSEFQVPRDELVGQNGTKETARIVMGPSVEVGKKTGYPWDQGSSGPHLRAPVDTGRYSLLSAPARSTDRSGRSKCHLILPQELCEIRCCRSEGGSLPHT